MTSWNDLKPKIQETKFEAQVHNSCKSVHSKQLYSNSLLFVIQVFITSIIFFSDATYCLHKMLCTLWITRIRTLLFVGARSGLPFPSPMHACMHAKSLQSCLTLCNPVDGSPPGSAVSGILQARILEWLAISFSNKEKRKI